MEIARYEKLDYSIYQKRINYLLSKEILSKMGIKQEIITNTTFNYPLECISIGYGNKEIFVVGGSHGSELIGVDFVTQLINYLPNCEYFDPNEFTIKCIPSQNPEGFDISTSNLKRIKHDEFQNTAYEYYQKYRFDYATSKAITSFQTFLNTYSNVLNEITPAIYLEKIKDFIKNDQSWNELITKNIIPDLYHFNLKVIQIGNCYSYLDIIKSIQFIINDFLGESYLKSSNLYYLLKDLNNLLACNLIPEKRTKLHQQMFFKPAFTYINNKQMAKYIIDVYRRFPLGSSINHDANGIGVNLNANCPNNPGIKAIKEHKKIYSLNANDNLLKYTIGPVGVPCRNELFSYEPENSALLALLDESQKKGKYTMTLLYHGTGGLIYYKPSELLMSSSLFQIYNSYNEELTNVYNGLVNYDVTNISETTGFGDYLRKTYPGVLLIELSKMGGNPIAPYGDKNNFYNVMNDNFASFNELLKYLHNKDVKKLLKK